MQRLIIHRTQWRSISAGWPNNISGCALGTPFSLLSLDGIRALTDPVRVCALLASKGRLTFACASPLRSLRRCGPLSTSPACSQHKAHLIAHCVAMLLFPKTTSGTWILTTQGCLGNTCSLNSSRHKDDRRLARGHCFKERKSRYAG